MNITAKLAYSQLKINRSRTLWAITAIVLSTALTTAVSSFVVSGNAMVVRLLGADYGEYGSTYLGLLLVPAIFFGLIIVSMSVVVISNIFRISAGERTAQFGILKCVGATGKQIKESVLYESVFLSAAGIPIGVIAGLLLAFAGTKIGNIYVDELNDLVHLMMTEIHLELTFVCSWKGVLISVLISFLTVLYSAWRPADKAAKKSAVDSVHGVGTIKLQDMNLHTSDWIQRVFGMEGTLAVKNLRRSRRNFRATMTALSTGFILFICLGSLSGQAEKLGEYMQPDIDETTVAEYISARDYKTNGQTGKRESVYLRPFDSTLGDTITEQLEQYEEAPIFGMGVDSETYYTGLSKEYITDAMLTAIAYMDQQSNELPVEIITMDTRNYSRLCKKAGAENGAVILLNHYSYNNNGKEVHLIPYQSKLKKLELFKADGSRSEVFIGGVLTQKDIPKECFSYTPSPIRLVFPQAMVRGYSWYAAPEDQDQFISYANGVMNRMFPQGESESYMEAGFNTRVYKLHDYMKVMNMAVVLVLIFMYSFIALLMMIGFTSVVSTMTTNVLMRAREFAVLQSIGMTTDGIKRMLNLESIFCSVKSIAIGLPVSVVLTYFINKPIRAMFPIPYELPWVTIGLCVTGILVITCGITQVALHKLNTQNIIEAIRS